MANELQTVVEPPAVVELLRLVERFLSEEIVAQIHDDKLRFRVQVAANLLQIGRRELDNADGLQRDRDGYLVTAELLRDAGSLRELQDQLLAGHREITEPQTFALLRDYVDAKLRIAAPKIVGAEHKENASGERT